MDTFNFPYHPVPQDEYPVNSVTLRFGSGYSYASKPKGPPQLIFHLSFEAMWWFTQNGVIDRTFTPTTLPGTNIAALIDFYEAHGLWDYFLYPHVSRGTQTVRFSKPLTTPKNMKGTFSTSGAYVCQQVEPFTLDFIGQP